jgi:hypothetical protein
MISVICILQVFYPIAMGLSWISAILTWLSFRQNGAGKSSLRC